MELSINLFLTRWADFADVRKHPLGELLMLSTLLKNIVDDTAGATAIEYGLIASLIVVAMLAALQSVASSTGAMWNNVETRSNAAMAN